VPIYVFRCGDSEGGCGVRFERLLPLGAGAPGCPACGQATRKVPARPSLGGRASAGLSKEQMPQTWRGLHDGDREYVVRMQRTWEQRQRVEAEHPELAGDQRPILAHEGRYHDVPLRAGDVPEGTARRSGDHGDLGSGGGAGGGGTTSSAGSS